MEKKEWLEWRNKGIGASDAASILGISPYKTPYQLWEEKKELTTLDKPDTYITAKGNAYEPYARAKYELINDTDMPPMMAEHHQIPWLRCTLDGGNQAEKKGIEIKYVGKDVHQATKESQLIPTHFLAQIQHQLIVTGFKSIDYLSYYVASGNDENGNKIKPDPANGDLCVVTVYPDQQWIDRYLTKAMEFWNLVQTDTPPELIDDDIRVIKGQGILADQYIQAKKALDEAEEKLEEIKKQLIEVTKGAVKSTFGNTGVTVVKQTRIGSVNYKAIPELKDVDLNQYRGKSSSFYTVKC